MSNEATARQVQVVSMALAVALVDVGWVPSTSPGEEIVLGRDGHELRPFTELPLVAEGIVTGAARRERCAALGIADLPLADGVGV